mmetsp:Transcript_4555/g.6925  ORF Transcript_4555/g.6925 Transcript_4555/m.6925 type:complete len:208 (+) Transcript_4555:159-782(+)
MPLHESGNVEFWLLQNLDFANVTLLDRENFVGRLFNILSTVSTDEGIDESLEISFISKLGHVFYHLCSDSTNLSRLGVTSLLDLLTVLGGEGNAEHSNNVSVGSFNINIGFDDGLTLLDETADLVPGHIHTVEVGETVVSLNVLDTELDLTVTNIIVVLEIGEGDLDNTSLKSVRGNLLTGGFGDDSLSEVLGLEHGRGLESVPFFL